MSGQIFAKAKTVRDLYQQTVAAIRNDRILSPHDKRMALAEAHRDANSQLDGLKEQYDARVESKDAIQCGLIIRNGHPELYRAKTTPSPTGPIARLMA